MVWVCACGVAVSRSGARTEDGTHVGFTKHQRGHRFEPGRASLTLRHLPPAAALRVVGLALLAIAGAGWALARHYTHAMPPMRVPLPPSAAPTYDPDAGEVPVPDLEPADVR